MDWPIAEAKSKLSELITRAGEEGPQIITRRDEAYVVINKKTYDELIGDRPTFKQWLIDGPSLKNLDLPSRQHEMREIDL